MTDFKAYDLVKVKNKKLTSYGSVYIVMEVYESTCKVAYLDRDEHAVMRWESASHYLLMNLIQHNSRKIIKPENLEKIGSSTLRYDENKGAVLSLNFGAIEPDHPDPEDVLMALEEELKKEAEAEQNDLNADW